MAKFPKGSNDHYQTFVQKKICNSGNQGSQSLITHFLLPDNMGRFTRTTSIKTHSDPMSRNYEHSNFKD